jgi:hypothetical protein
MMQVVSYARLLPFLLTAGRIDLDREESISIQKQRQEEPSKISSWFVERPKPSFFAGERSQHNTTR